MYFFILIVVPVLILLWVVIVVSKSKGKQPETDSKQLSVPKSKEVKLTDYSQVKKVKKQINETYSPGFSDLYTYNYNAEELEAWYECYAAIDFETAMPSRNSACSLGVVIFDKEKILHKFYTLIQPPSNEYFYQNIRIHGLKPDDTANSPTFKDLYPILERLLPDKKIVAHNASFDIDVFYKSAFYYDIEPCKLTLGLDTYRYYNAKLHDLCVFNDIKIEHHHAGSDAEACALLAIKAINIIHVETLQVQERVEEIKIARAKREKEILSKPRAEQVYDPSNPFNSKNIVITGEFANFPDRQYLRDLLSKIGADIKSGITHKTNLLVKGDKPGPAKISLANKHIENGQELMIIDEFELLQMLAGIVIDQYEDGDFIKYQFIQINKNQFSLVNGTKLKPRANI